MKKVPFSNLARKPAGRRTTRENDIHVITLLNSINRINSLVTKIIKDQINKRIIHWKSVKKNTEINYEITLPTKEVFTITISFFKFEKKQYIDIVQSSRYVKFYIKKEISDAKLESLIKKTINARFVGFKAEMETYIIYKEKIAFVPPFIGIEKPEAYDDMFNHVDFYLLLDVDGTVHKIPIDAKVNRSAQKHSIEKNGLGYPTVSYHMVKKILSHENGEKRLYSKTKNLAFDYLSNKALVKKRIHI